MKRSSPRVTISAVICTRNRPDDITACLNSIAFQHYLPDEIIIVDSSDDNKTELVVNCLEIGEPTEIVYLHTKPGLTFQRNIGIAKSSKEVVAFLDDDIILDKEYFFHIAMAFSLSDDVYGVGGRIINQPELSWLSKIFRKLFMLYSFESFEGKMKRSGFAEFQMREDLENILETKVLCGCSCYKRDIFKEFAYDEYFEGYGYMEDIDFSYRVGKSYRLVFSPFAKMIHNHSPAWRINQRHFYEMQINNHHYVFRKNIKKHKIDWIFFWWSNIGIIIRGFFFAVRVKDLSPIIGIFNGYKKIFKRTETKAL